jgi:lipopolysaccharide/colanic/teichoic acid biosynthesis glycosyltransferase
MGISNKPPEVLRHSYENAVDPAIASEPISLIGRTAKRALDIVVATLGLILLSPTFLLVSIAIEIGSRGPVFRSQLIHGYNDEKIAVLKFRTGPVSEIRRDPPLVTRIGAVLRQSGLDGLPQLINVLRGEMSIVGPAPYSAPPSVTFAERSSLIRKGYWLKPGITGWAQVNGCCGESKWVNRQRMDYDRYYIEEWSFFLDIKIIIMSLFS